MRVSIAFGAMADPLKDQLRQQGLHMNAGKCGHFQRDMDAINRLLIRGMASDSEGTKIRRRLLKSILEEIDED